MSGYPITLTGRSGRSYPLTFFPKGTRFKPIGGVYVAINRPSTLAYAFPPPNSLGNGFTAQYVGQTSDLSQRPEHHHREMSFALVGVSHFAVLVEHNEQYRRQIEADLIAALQPPLNRTDHG